MKGRLLPLALTPRQEHPGQGDVLELAQVRQVVISGQVLLTRPAEGSTESALPDPDLCPQRRNRPHIREEVADIAALRLVEQVKGAGQVALSLRHPGHGYSPAIPVLRQSGVLAQILARQQALGGGAQVAALAVDLASRGRGRGT